MDSWWPALSALACNCTSVCVELPCLSAVTGLSVLKWPVIHVLLVVLLCLTDLCIPRTLSCLVPLTSMFVLSLITASIVFSQYSCLNKFVTHFIFLCVC